MTSKTFWLVIGLTLLRIPFLWTRHVLDAAYIHWRHALNLAETRVYGFNPYETVNGSSSLLYTLLSSFFYGLFGKAAAPYFIMLTNALLLNIAIVLFAYAYSNRPLFLTVLVSLSPPALAMSYTGMETALLLFTLALTIRWKLSAILLPSIRIDSILYIGLWAILEKARRKCLLYFGISALVYLLINQILFAEWLPQAILGKSEIYAIRFDEILKGLFWTFGIYDADILNRIQLIPILIGIGLTAWSAWYTHIPAVFLAWIFLPPLVYGFTIFVSLWHIWPSALFFVFLASHALTDIHYQKGWNSKVAIIGAAVLAIGQFILSLQNGAEIYQHRRLVGLWFKEYSPKDATIFLEPTGTIGYFSERIVYDATGILSPEIVAYRNRYGGEWVVQFLHDYEPTYLVFAPAPSGSDNFLNYLYTNYEPIEAFHYQSNRISDHWFIQWILDLGTAPDFVIFQRRSVSGEIGFWVSKSNNSTEILAPLVSSKSSLTMISTSSQKPLSGSQSV